jgi:hypothetical protein
VNGTTSNFAVPVRLPCFVNGERMPYDVWANGCLILNRTWDGRLNRSEIVPLVAPPGLICAFVPVGESYRIADRDLRGLIGEGDSVPFAVGGFWHKREKGEVAA